MDSSQHLLEKPVVVGEQSDQGVDIKEKVTNMAFNGLLSSQEYKQPRMGQLALYEQMYNGYITPKMRQLFNVPIPIFPGMIDTLLADFNDAISIKYKALNPGQHLIVPKLQAHLDAEKSSFAPNAMWDQKARWDRFNAMISGRGIFKIWSESVPEYRNVLEVVNYSDFHCQAMGGGNLENHLFAGQEGIFRTIEDIARDPSFDKGQVEKLRNYGFTSEWQQTMQTQYGTKLSRFLSLGQNPTVNSFTGDKTFNLCEFVVTYEGVRWYVIFEPLTQIWLRCQPWKEIVPSGLYPWVSWGTHEDQKVFWSKSYADDFFYVADAVITLFNQELTNREKQNFHAQAYDEDMFTDVAALDDAQYRPDALVPVTPGVKAIRDGIYSFETPELQGTINLIGWMAQFTGQQTGVSDVQQGEVEASKKPTVVIAQQQQIGKRVKLRTDPMQEAYAQLGIRFMEGVKENMPVKISVQVLGESGFIEEQQFKRIEIRRAGNIGVGVVSLSEQEKMDTLKRQGRINAIDILSKNPNLTKYEKEEVLRSIGQYSDDEVKLFMDENAYESKDQIAYASTAISDMVMRKMPEIYYGADWTYLEYIENYMINNKAQLKEREELFAAHLEEMFPVVIKNVERKAAQIAFKQKMKALLEPKTQQQTPQNQPGMMQTQQPGMGMQMPNMQPDNGSNGQIRI